MDHLATIDDPRDPRGRRYTLPALLARLDPAQLTGAGLACLHTRTPPEKCPPRTPTGAPEREHRRAHNGQRRRSPHRAPRHIAYATDGKTQRGARTRKGQRSTSVVFHAARHHDAAVVASTPIRSKGAETSAFTTLLDQLDDDHLRGVLITADALHTVADHAAYLRERRAHYLIYVKGNRPTLHGQLAALPWDEVPLATRRDPSMPTGGKSAACSRSPQWRGWPFPERARWCASSVTAAGTAPSRAAARWSSPSPTWTPTRSHRRSWPLMPAGIGRWRTGCITCGA
ncbi:transposase [Nocardiopsis quinghaiensis]|uniref:transposase n=1 Tax=Nocardiopsis quinghaiensis TaxID=464995 RepID=UPI0016814B09|nr:transposase [Nocardiopsis quinghaiensis]